jgi:MFS family permease
MMLLVESSIFSFAMTFIDFTIIVPAFISTITDSAVIIGALFAVQNICLYLPQLIAAKHLSAKPFKKTFLFYNWFLGKLPLGVFSLTLILFGLVNPATLLVLFFVTTATFWMSEGMGAVTWLDIIGKVIPSQQRRRFFGLLSVGGGLCAILSGVIVNSIQHSQRYPVNYTVLFSASFFLILVSAIVILFIREQPSVVDTATTTFMAFFTELPRMLNTNPALRNLAFTQLFVNCVGLATPFYTLYAIHNLALGYDIVGLLVFTQTVGRVLAGLLIIVVGNKWLSNTLLQLGISLTLAVPVAILGIWGLSQSLDSVDLLLPYLLVSTVRGASLAMLHTGTSNALLEILRPADRSKGIGVINTLNSLSTVMPLIGGAIVGLLPIEAIFVITVVPLSTSLVFAKKVALNAPAS